MTDALVLDRIEKLTQAVQQLSASMGTRLTRTQLRNRLGVSDNTLRKREAIPGFPPRDSFGRFLLSDVIAWESRHPQKIPKN
jgi:hypothetical protein